jgi:hypothetical protein
MMETVETILLTGRRQKLRRVRTKVVALPEKNVPGRFEQLDEMVRNRAQQIEPSSDYSRPDIRSRATGSIDA